MRGRKSKSTSSEGDNSLRSKRAASRARIRRQNTPTIADKMYVRREDDNNYFERSSKNISRKEIKDRQKVEPSDAWLAKIFTGVMIIGLSVVFWFILADLENSGGSIRTHSLIVVLYKFGGKFAVSFGIGLIGAGSFVWGFVDYLNRDQRHDTLKQKRSRRKVKTKTEEPIGEIVEEPFGEIVEEPIGEIVEDEDEDNLEVKEAREQ